MDITVQRAGFLALLIVLASLQTWQLHHCDGASTLMTRCREDEREALLHFKGGLKDPHGRLSSWTGRDCCRWEGIECNNMTGRVTRLDIQSPYSYYDDHRIEGHEIDPSLLALHDLSYLDLSGANFSGAFIPKFIGSFRRLVHLDLSDASFGGRVPSELGNLSTLRYLDLSSFEDEIEDGSWLSRLSSLRHLYLNRVSIKNASLVLESLGTLPLLSDLQLSSAQISIPNALPHVNFTSLRVLGLSGVFSNATMPPWLFEIGSLENLDLSSNSFFGHIPVAISNLTSLQVLEMSYSEFHEEVVLAAFAGVGKLSNLGTLSWRWGNLRGRLPLWLGNMTKLQTLDLSFNQLNGTLHLLGNMTKLQTLDLSFNQLNGTLHLLGNMTKLQTLDLSHNQLNGTLHLLGNMTKLQTLDLSHNQLNGTLHLLGNMTKLQTLDLSHNQLNGTLHLLGNMTKLQTLDLSHNQLNGTLQFFGQLSGLVSLDLSDNNFDDVVTNAHFENLTRLGYLSLSSNPLIVRIGPQPISHHLTHVNFGNCTVGPSFPSWLKTMGNISDISLFNAGISDVIPDWFWNFSSTLNFIDLSNNMIRGKFPPSLTHLSQLRYLNMMNNQLKGPFPQFSSNLFILILNNNSLSGSIPSNIDDVSRMSYLTVSANKLNGSIPTSACRMMELQILDLSDNNLSGEIPDCWGNIKQLEYIYLNNNNLSGGIPASIGSLRYLDSLHLESNNLSGGIPSALRNCTALRTLDLGNNKLSGHIPDWLGRIFEFDNGQRVPNFESLYTLGLGSNMFVGNIPSGLGNLPSLMVIDLSQNMLSGLIPKSFENLSAMKSSHGNEYQNDGYSFEVDNNEFEEYKSIHVVSKGRYEEYGKLREWLVSIDLSSNRLSGNIPEGLTILSGLKIFNLSRNHLTGSIPQNVTGFQDLESLDFSHNNLVGQIPESMTYLSSLGVMDFSFNNLSGMIPTGGPFQSHPDASIYLGNKYLCGFPLAPCGGSVSSRTPQSNNYDGGQDIEREEVDLWFYLSMAPGFVIGFWAFVGAVLLKEKRRIAYYQCIDSVYDEVYVFMAIKLANMRRP